MCARFATAPSLARIRLSLGLLGRMETTGGRFAKLRCSDVLSMQSGKQRPAQHLQGLQQIRVRFNPSAPSLWSPTQRHRLRHAWGVALVLVVAWRSGMYAISSAWPSAPCRTTGRRRIGSCRRRPGRRRSRPAPRARCARTGRPRGSRGRWRASRRSGRTAGGRPCTGAGSAAPGEPGTGRGQGDRRAATGWPPAQRAAHRSGRRESGRAAHACGGGRGCWHCLGATSRCPRPMICELQHLTPCCS